MRGQSSVEVLYQQSIANAPNGDVTSARVFDPTRAKTYHMGSGDLEAIPGSVVTSNVFGKFYFFNLPPHLSERFYFDPVIGESGVLVFVGEFKDEFFGEKYFFFNVFF